MPSDSEMRSSSSSIRRQHPMKETQLEHRVHGAIHAGRNDDEFERLPVAEARRDGEVAVRHLTHAERPVVLGCLPDQPIAEADNVIGIRRRQRMGGESPESTGPVPDVDGTDERVQVLGEKREDLLAERIEPLFPAEPVAQVGLARADPHLFFSCAILARRRDRGARDEHEQHNRAAPCHAGGEVDRLLPLSLTCSQHGALRILHFRHQASNPVHAGLGAIGSRDVCRSLGAARAPHRDGLGT